ncbi:MAG: hypothetical protein ABFD09_00855 [Proteiniphilum sp.]
MNTKIDFQENKKNLSRRRFISSCLACGACMAISPAIANGMVGTPYSSSINKKVRIRTIYSLLNIVQNQPDWPNLGFNFGPVIQNINNTLKNEFPAFEFISTLATVQTDAEKILAEDVNNKIDGYIVFQMNCKARVVETIAKSTKPVLYVDFQYGGSGRFLQSNSSFLAGRQNNVGFVSSSRVEDLIAAVKSFEIPVKGGSMSDFVKAINISRLKSTPTPGNLFCTPDKLDNTLSVDECRRRLKESKILAIRDQNVLSAKPIMGIPLEYVPFAEVNQAWEIADKDEVKEIANKWQNKASKIEGVSFDELQNSAAFYLGMKSVLKKHNASAITISCLKGFYGNYIHAYPCLGFHELANEGLVGACEGDINSTATMLAFSTMTGRPGFISDPVIDTSKRQIIYAHCVAPTKMFGVNGPTNPYNIMTHSEDRKGASIRSFLPIGYLTSTLKIWDKTKEIVFHQAKAVDNDPNDRACRTKLCAEPLGDIEKLFTQWHTYQWHRVTFYGDMKEQVYEMADSIGWKVVEEA